MILLKEIRLKNFLSHSDTQLKFEPGSKKLLDGISGAGKSSIIDALLWGLYGKGRTDNRSLIKRGADAVGVQILLTEGEKEYRIERQYSKAGKQNLDIAEKVGDKYVPIKIVGIKFMQEHIETKILKSSYLLFINSIAYPQDNQENFVKQTAEKRKDIILEIIKASDYDVYYDKAKEALKNLEVKCAGLAVEEANTASNLQATKTWIDAIPIYQKTIQEKKSLLDYVNTTITTLEAKKAEYDAVHLKRFELDSKNGFLNQTKASLVNKKSVCQNTLTQYASLNLEPLREKVKKLTELREELTTLEEQRTKHFDWVAKRAYIPRPVPVVDLQPKINALIDKANKVTTEPTRTCDSPTCPFMATIKEDQEARINSINEEITKLLADQKFQVTDEERYKTEMAKIGDQPPFDEVTYNSIKAQITQLVEFEAQLARYANITADIERINKEIAEIDVALVDTEKQLEENTKAISELPVVEVGIALSSEIHIKRQESTVIQLDIQKQEIQLNTALEAQKQSDILNAKLQELKKQLGVYTQDRTALDLIKDALGNKGVKSIIIDYVIPQLEDKINEVLSKLSDFRVALETQKEGVGGDTIIDGLFITITNGQGESFDLASYSGGEKMRITTAISEGLASLQKTGFRIFDESIVGLDAATVEGFTEILMQIQNNFSQVMCVSHLQPIKDLFEEKITVIKKGGDSFIQ